MCCTPKLICSNVSNVRMVTGSSDGDDIGSEHDMVPFGVMML